MPVWLEIIAANAIFFMALYIHGVNKELRETKAQLQETRRKLEKSQAIGQLLLDEKFGRAKKSKPKEPDFLSADDPLDAITRQVSVHRP